MELYLHTKFRWDISIYGWDKTTSGFGKRTTAILELYFRVWFWRMCSHFASACQFRCNWTIGGGVMTSYEFFKMAAIESEMYFGVQLKWLHLFKNVKIYLHANFRWCISIHGWEKTTSGFGKRTAAILEIFFWFRLRPIHSHRHIILSK